ncbi:MAG: 50S ribosomal protein L11 methyltransferase [Thiotrichales bacterium]|nr:50S ribosomal protein L11 methyltransferase [Thiotrichales bacterium]
MSWLQLSIETDPAHTDALTGFFEQFSAASISISAASDEPVFDQCDARDPQHWQRTRVSALLPADVDMDILLVCLRDRIGAGHIYAHHIEAVMDRDWVAGYRQQVAPLIFADRLCVCPNWCTVPDPRLAVIELDPGLAFGTGTHATTALCLDWLARQELAGRSVIDFGCGSGILALAAARLGAGPVTALDIDPQALQASRDNALKNGLQDRIVIADPAAANITAADILIANVLLNPLLESAQRFGHWVRPNGTLVLSGLLPDQVDACLAAYQACFKLQAPTFRDEWALLQGTRIQN